MIAGFILFAKVQRILETKEDFEKKDKINAK
jgi:hypothetical protein